MRLSVKEHQTLTHPWPTGHTFYSPGGHLGYRVVGPCCRLFDREQLPWPCCRLEWRGKEPSWRRIGKRYIPDMATRQFPSYAVELLDHNTPRIVVITLYMYKLTAAQQEWWHSRRTQELPLKE